jgi:hypothetical protein
MRYDDSVSEEVLLNKVNMFRALFAPLLFGIGNVACISLHSNGYSSTDSSTM